MAIKAKKTVGEFLRMRTSSSLPSQKKRALRSLLLDINDVPSEAFDTRQNLSFLTGVGDSANGAVVARARDVGSVTVWRKMRNERSKRALWVQLIPLATPADAQASLSSVDLKGMPLAPSMENRTVTLDDFALEGVPNFVAFEQTSADSGRQIEVLVLVGALDKFEFALGFESRMRMWTWDEAKPLVELQIQKILEGSRQEN